MQVMCCKILISLNVLAFPPSLAPSCPEVKCEGNQTRDLPQNDLTLFTFVISDERPPSDSFHAGIMDTVVNGGVNVTHTHARKRTDTPEDLITVR